MPIIKMGEEGLAHTIDNFLCSACNHRFFYEADDETGDEALYPPPEFCPKCGHGHRKLKRDIRRMNMADKFELDHATDSGAGTQYFIIHGPLPKGIAREYGYPICDSMNRHHCISPEEDEANGKMVLRALNCHEGLISSLLAIRDSATDGRECPEWLRERLQDAEAVLALADSLR